MNRSFIALCVAMSLGMIGCSSTPKTASLDKPAEETKVPVKDARISTEFRDQGIKLHYSLMGKLEKIEVIGIAPAWKGNHTILAELDAKEKLVKFVHGESMKSDTKNRIITKTLDRARDQTLNRFESNNEFDFDASDIEQEFNRNEGAAPGQPDNTSRRTAERIERSLVQKTVILTSQGRLRGLRKVGDSVSKDGRYYIARYEWSEKAENVADQLRNRWK